MAEIQSSRDNLHHLHALLLSPHLNLHSRADSGNENSEGLGWGELAHPSLTTI